MTGEIAKAPSENFVVDRHATGAVAAKLWDVGFGIRLESVEIFLVGKAVSCILVDRREFGPTERRLVLREAGHHVIAVHCETGPLTVNSEEMLVSGPADAAPAVKTSAITARAAAKLRNIFMVLFISAGRVEGLVRAHSVSWPCLPRP
jgi:hypothetical protein